MAYTDRRASITTGKTAAIITVAGLHGMAIFGLVTGLGVTYVTENVPLFKARFIEADPPPPLPPEPVPQPRATQKPEPASFTTAVDKRLPVAREATIVDRKPALPAGDPAGEERLVEISGPKETPPPFVPRAVRPRNDPGGWVTPADYPAAELRAGRQGTVQFEVAIGDDGKVRSCRVTQSSGSAALDDVACRNIARRARFEPATDGFGTKVGGTYSGKIRWVIPDD